MHSQSNRPGRRRAQGHWLDLASEPACVPLPGGHARHRVGPAVRHLRARPVAVRRRGRVARSWSTSTAPLIIAAWVVMLNVFGAFQLRHLRAGAVEYKRVVIASFAMAGLVGIGSYLLKSEFPRGIFVLLFGIGTTGLVLARFARRKAMGAIHRQGALMTPIVVAGESGHVDEIAKVLRRETWLGYRVVGAVTRDRVDQTPGGLPVLGGLEDTVAVIDEHQVATVIFAEGSFQRPERLPPDGLAARGARHPHDRRAGPDRHQRPAPRRPARRRTPAGRRRPTPGHRGSPLDQADLRRDRRFGPAAAGCAGDGAGRPGDQARGRRPGAVPADAGRPSRGGVRLPEVPQHERWTPRRASPNSWPPTRAPDPCSR